MAKALHLLRKHAAYSYRPAGHDAQCLRDSSVSTLAALTTIFHSAATTVLLTRQNGDFRARELAI